MSRLPIMFVFLTGLSACSSLDRDYVASIPVGASAPRSPAAIKVPAALGAVKNVEDRRYANGLDERIVLDNGEDGDNRIDVAFFRTDGTGAGADRLTAQRPARAEIEGEIVSRFPGVGMHIVTTPRRNARGPIGMAVGQSQQGVKCLYAWQWIDEASSGERGVVASLRARLCSRRASLDQMAGALEDMEIFAPKDLAADVSLESLAARPDGAVRRAAGVKAPIKHRAKAPDVAHTPDGAMAPQSGPLYLAPVAGDTSRPVPVGAPTPSIALPDAALRGPANVGASAGI